MSPLRSILVTGSSGRIGSAICAVARKQGLRVVGLDSRPDALSAKADITHGASLAKWFEGIDCVFHCAGLHAPHVRLVTNDRFQKVNVGGTQNVLQAVKQAGVPRIVLTSSTAVLGGGSEPGHPARWIDEMTPAVPRTIYHTTKIEAELEVRKATGPDLKASIVRLGRCFEEGRYLTTVYRLSRGISVRGATTAHLCAANACDLECKPMIASAQTPFDRDDMSALGCDASSIIEDKCSELPAVFAARGWAIPTRIDRVYDSAATQKLWQWTPRDDIHTTLARLS
ncbi:MAG: NAD(P)-dependent oxidoreductase [Aliishimia sp.]